MSNAHKTELVLYCLYPSRVSFYSISLIYVGFLCGRCPEGKGVDLTLRQCKECTVGDAIGVAIVCEFVDSFNLPYTTYSYTENYPTQMWHSLWHHFLCCSSTLESPMNLKDAFSIFKYSLYFLCSILHASVIMHLFIGGWICI